MSEHTHDSTTEPGLAEKANEKVQQVKETVRDTVPPEVREQGEKVITLVQEKTRGVDVLQLVTCVAVVGILINNRRSLKFSKKVFKSIAKDTDNLQKVITDLKNAGKPFTYYPGVGVWVE